VDRLKTGGENMHEIRTTYYTRISKAAARKAYIAGDTVDRLVKEDRMEEKFFRQMEDMCRVLYAAGLNIDYFPTNFVVREGKLYYIDFECNEYQSQWNFENWGSQYWWKSEEFKNHFGED
jgi:hypothetical protein